MAGVFTVQHQTDAQKLLRAVGERSLRSGLPKPLLAVLETERARLTGVKLAEAAIATYHTAALKEYRDVLPDAPERWAGSPSAVAFVRSLGFSDEWAGGRNPRREPYLDVEGPCSLPELHDYQERIVVKVRAMLCNRHVNGNGRRGMISLPTGSCADDGKADRRGHARRSSAHVLPRAVAGKRDTSEIGRFGPMASIVATYKNWAPDGRNV